MDLVIPSKRKGTLRPPSSGAQVPLLLPGGGQREKKPAALPMTPLGLGWPAPPVLPTGSGSASTQSQGCPCLANDHAACSPGHHPSSSDHRACWPRRQPRPKITVTCHTTSADPAAVVSGHLLPGSPRTLQKAGASGLLHSSPLSSAYTRGSQDHRWEPMAPGHTASQPTPPFCKWLRSWAFSMQSRL